MQDDPTSVCPSDRQIEAVVHGNLNNESVRLHLEQCDRCRAAADAVRSDDAFLDRLERAGTAAAAPRTEPPAVPGYQILAEIKRGGQGVVYEAVQVATARKVALKIPVSGALATPAQRSRFQREARLAAAVDHPNVAVIYAVTSAGDQPVLVFEFVPGQSLSERLDGGPLPLPEALGVARQVAAGIAAAHERSVIHRDLKPSNVKLTPAGVAKILDFGLARSAADERVAARDERTLVGAIVGTPRYMSPEQARGTPVDQRTDIWSWACLVYECLTGSPAFDGISPSDAIAAVLSRQPDWSLLPESTPAAIRALMARCLEKDAARRPSNIGEALAEVARVLEAREWEHPERPRPPPPAAKPTNLPGELTSFIGRHRDLTEIKRLLASTRLLTLTGSGGCGKTRLALRAARDLLDDYPDGVRLVELAPLTDSSLVPHAAAEALGIREEPRTRLPETLAARLKEKHALIVLDNCEHVLGACSALVETLMRECPGVTILATSREPLGVAGECSWRVPSLSVPDDAGSAGPPGLFSDAARLFADRAAAVEPSFALTGENAASVAHICRRLDGIPLAIELAAARVRVMSVHQIAERLDDRFRLLTGGSRSAVPRQRTLSALIDWSYDLLSDPERALVRRLSVFAGGWTLEAAAAVSGARDEYEMLDLLTGLVDKSLVMADESAREKRYRLLETVRQYAAERLIAVPAPEGPEDVRDRHAAWFVEFAERAEKHLQGPDQGAWLARLELEHDNLRAALDWLGAQPDGPPAALRLAGALWRFWVTRGHLSEGRRRLAETLGHADRSAPSTARAKALSGAGTIAWGQADYPAATALLTESLDMRRALGDRSGVAASLNNLGLVAADAGGPDTARAMYEESLAIRRDLGDRVGEAAVLNNLGLLEYRAGRFGDARDLHERSLAIKRETQDRRAIAYSLGNLAYIAIAEGDTTRARDMAAECLTISRETGDPRGTAEAIELLASLAAGDAPERAVRLYAAVDALRRAIGAPPPPHERAEHLRRLAAASAAIGDAAFGARWSEGVVMSADDAARLALEWRRTGR